MRAAKPTTEQDTAEPSGRRRKRFPDNLHGGGGRALAAAFFVLYFNALFTYENVATTPWIRLTPKASLEVVVGLAVIALYVRFGYRASTPVKWSLAVVVFSIAVVRYVDTTAPGVMGRDFNVHADLPHVHRVAGMFWESLPLSTSLLVTGALLLIGAFGVTLNRWGHGVLESVMVWGPARRASWGLLAASLLVWSLRPLSTRPWEALYARPTSTVFAKQLGYLQEARAFAGQTFPSTAWSREAYSADLSGLGGAHVFLIFLESYGATLIDDEHHYRSLAPRFHLFEERLAQNGFAFASSKVLSPTFAGGSWRAHATVLSGIRIANEHFYNTLLASDRKTLVHLLKAEGYRTLSAEPGIQRDWPEGRFFDFDKVYDAQGLDYRGLTIGWWKIPDQYTLYKLYKDEIAQARGPLFVKFSLIMSHIPYFPVPPYVEDWSRFDDGTAFAASMPSIAADDYRDLAELSTRYVHAFLYELDILESFIVDFLPKNSLIIVCGDHQPPKLATHDNDSWAVPMQLISHRPELVEPFSRYGFRPGLVPHHPTGLSMEEFLPAFLEVFAAPSDGPEP